MTKCADCTNLTGAKSSTPPGSTLEYVGTDWHQADGHKTFQVERYRCLTCNTRWLRDMDPADKHAIWEPN